MAEDLGIDGNAAGGIDSGAPDQNLQTLHALHLDGKGAPQLEDADERSLNEAGDVRPDDVTGHANVQSAGRTTYEQMVEGGIREARVIPTGDNVVVDTVEPTFRDNEVDARFDNVQPTFIPDFGPDNADAGPEGENGGSRQFDPLISPDPLEPGSGEPAPEGGPASPAPQSAAMPESEAELVQPPAPTPEPQPSTPEEIIPKVADAPDVTVAAASGTEDLDTKLDITIALADRDGGNETISSITISNVPDGFSFVNGAGAAVGTHAGGGVWSFTQEQLADLYLRQPANYSGDLALTVSAVSRETSNGSTATTTTVLNVHVEAVADAPSLNVADSAGMENALIPLSITVGANDAALEGPGAYAPEVQTVYISNLPAGARLFIGDETHPVIEQVGPEGLTVDGVTIPAGAYVVRAADLPKLKVQSPPNDSHDFTLDVWSTSTEPSNGSTAITGPRTIEVDVGVSAPEVSGSGTGQEGDWAPLTLSANVTNPDGTEELRVFIADLPPGAELAYTDGTPVAQGPDGRYEITGRLDDLKVRWTDLRSDADITFNLVAEVRDGDTDTDSDAVKAAAPDLAVTTTPVTVTVQAVADGPSGLSATGTGVEDQWFDLDITTGLIDTDGSESLTVEITGPAGFLLADKNDTAHPYQGVTSPDGSTVTYTLIQAQLAGLQMRAKPDSDDDIPLTIKATTTETPTEAGDGQIAVASKSLTIQVNVQILSDADKPVVQVESATQTINEDAFFNLRTQIGDHFAVEGKAGEAGSQLGANTSADGSETLSFRIKPVEEGSRLAVDVNGDGTIDAGDLAEAGKYWNADGGYWEVPAELVNGGKVFVGGKADWASAGDDRLHFDIQTVATEIRDAGEAAPDDLSRQQTQVSDIGRLTLKVNPVADDVTVSASNSGYEDQQGGITVSPVLTFADPSERPVGDVRFSSTDPDLAGGHFTLTLDGQTITITPEFADGTYTWSVPASAFTVDGNVWTLSGLKYFPKAELARDVTYSVTVDTQDVTGGDIHTLPAATGTISVIAVADKPGVEVTDYQGVESADQQDIPLSINPVASSDTDGSESLFVYITGLPAGKASLVLADGTVVTPTDVTSVDGVNFGQGGEPVYKVAQADLAGLKLRVAGGYSDDMVLKVWSVTEEDQYAGQVVAGPDGDPDVFHAVSDPQIMRIELGVQAPTINVGTLEGKEGEFIALTNVTTKVAAGDGSETIKVFIEDLSDGAKLFVKSGSTYTALTPTTYTDAQGNQHTGYDVTSLRDPVTGQLSGVYVSWNGSNSSKSTSDANIGLKIRTVVWDRDVDPGHDTPNDPLGADAGGLHMETPYGAGDWRDINETVESATVVVKAVADKADLNGSAAAVEDKWVNLNLSAALKDTDGSETLTITIAGVPDGLALEGTTTPVTETVAADGSRTYTFGPFSSNAEIQAALSGLKLTGLGDGRWADTDGSFNLTVTATTTESASGGEVATKTATVTKTVTVDILSNADTPEVKVVEAPQTIAEDAFFNLHTQIGDHFAVEGRSGEGGSQWNANTSADGSEKLSFRITPVEEGSRLAIDRNGDGTIDAGDLAEAAKYWNAAGGYWEVPADLVNGNKVWVGGAANWASQSDTDHLHFDIRTVATETRDAGKTGPADMPRSDVAVSDPLRLTLNVTPVADRTTITLSGSGVEDQVGGIAFTPTIKLDDSDGSESLTGHVEVMVRSDSSGAFPGKIAFDGTVMDGTVELHDGQYYCVFRVPVDELSGNAADGYTLSGLTFIPTQHSDLDIQYRVRVTTTESANSDTYVTVSSLATLEVAAVADAPVLTINGSTGEVTIHDQEDGGADGLVLLDLGVHLTDTDGSEVLTNVELRAVPEGWGVVVVDKDGNISAVEGTGPDAAGRYTFALDPAIFKAGSGLSVALVPPPDSDVDATGIQLWARSTEVTGAANPNDPDPNDNQVAQKTAEKTLSFNVQLDPVADEPVLMVTNARTNEEQEVKLDIRAAITDRQGDETAEVEISGVPDGGVLKYTTANGEECSVTFGNGVTSLTISPAEARTLRFTPPEDASGTYTLVVKVTSTDVDAEDSGKSHSATRTATLDVVVKGVNDAILDRDGNPVADADKLTAIGTEDANGNLVNLVNLGLGDYRIDDIDDPVNNTGSETLSAVISGLPAGVSLVVKTGTGVADAADALQYIGKDENGAPMWSVPESLLKYVFVQVPHNYAGSFDLSVRLVATERDGAATAIDKTLTVTVKPDADRPSGWVVGEHAEDAQLNGDGGLAFSLNAEVSDGALNLPALGNGTVESITGLSATVNVDALVARLKEGLPEGEEPNLSGIYVTWEGAAEPYTVTKTDDGHYVIQLTGLPAPGGTGISLDGFKLYGVPEDWSRDVPVTLSVEVTDGSGADKDVDTFDLSSSIVIKAVADAPDIAWASSDPGHVYQAAEGTNIITIVADGGITTTDADGSEHFYVVVSGVPNGVVVVGGINNGNGSWTLPTNVSKVVLIDHTGSGLAKDLTITTVVTDVDPDGGTDTRSFANTVPVQFGTGGGGGGSEPVMTADVTGSLTTVEDDSVTLDGITITVTDDSNQALTVGADGKVTNAGGDQLGDVSLVVRVPAGWTLSGSGYYLLGDEGGVQTYTVPYEARGDVILTPPKDYAGSDVTLDVRAVVTDLHGHYHTTDNGSDMVSLPIVVTPETDGAAISVSVGDAAEDAAAIPLSLTISSLETQHFSETLEDGVITVTIGKVEGTGGNEYLPGTLQTGTLENGAVVECVAEGVYTIQLTAEQMAAFANGDHKVVLDGLVFVPDRNFSGNVSLAVKTDVLDSGVDPETSTSTVTFTVKPVVDTPTLTAGTLAGNEDEAIALDVSIQHEDLAGTGQWGSETMSVVISGVPEGARIIGATNNGPTTDANGNVTYSWTVDRSRLEFTENGIVLKDVAYVSPTDDSRDVDLTFTAYSFEKGVAEPVSASETFRVTVHGVTDGATLNPNNAGNLEDQLVAIDLGAQQVDPTEQTYIVIKGVPEGASLRDVDGNPVGTAGPLDGDTNTRTWTLSIEDVEQLGLMTGGKLYFLAGEHVSGSWTLTAQAFTKDPDGTTAVEVASNPLSFTVTVEAVADAPTLTAPSEVTLAEDGKASLSISATLVDRDSEALTVTIEGAPEGTIIRINRGTDAVPDWQDIHGQGGTWTISGAQGVDLDKIEIEPPANYNGSFDLYVTASSVESTGGEPAVSATKKITVTVDAVNDAPTVEVVASGIGIEAGSHSNPITVLGALGAGAVTFDDVDFGDDGAERVLGGMTVTIGGSGVGDGDSLALTGLPVTLNEDGKLVTTLASGREIVISYDPDTRTLSFTGEASPEEFAELASHVTFSSTTGTLAGGQREITFAVTDGEGAVSAPAAGVTITVNGTATLRGEALGDVAFDSSGAPVLPADTINTVEDAAPFALGLDMAGRVAAGVAVVIAGLPEGAILRDADGAEIPPGSLTADKLAGLRLQLPDDWSGSATLTLTATVNGTTLSEQVTVNAAAVNDAPTVTVDDAAQSVVGTDGALSSPLHVVPPGSDVTVADVDGTVITGMTVRLLPGDDNAYALGDTLGLYGHDIALNGDCQLIVKDTDILVSYDSASHTLTFSGSADHATYADLAKSVVLSNTGNVVAAGTRTFSITMYDEASAPSTSVTTTLELEDGARDSFTLAQDAHGTVYWNGSTPVLNGTEGDDTFQVTAGSDWSVNGMGGTDTLILGGIEGDWTFTINQDDHSVLVTSATDPSVQGIIRLEPGSSIQPFANGANEIVFNGSANGTIEFSTDHVVAFQHLEKLQG